MEWALLVAADVVVIAWAIRVLSNDSNRSPNERRLRGERP